MAARFSRVYGGLGEGLPVDDAINCDLWPCRSPIEVVSIVALAAFLCSEQAARVTGQSIPVDGGINRHL